MLGSVYLKNMNICMTISFQTDAFFFLHTVFYKVFISNIFIVLICVLYIYIEVISRFNIINVASTIDLC